MPPGSKGRCTLGRKEAQGFRRVRPGAEAACPLPALPLGPAARQGLRPAATGRGNASPAPRLGETSPAERRLRAWLASLGPGRGRRCHPAEGRPCLPPGQGLWRSRLEAPRVWRILVLQ